MNDTSAIPSGAVLDSFSKLIEKPVIKKQSAIQDKIANLVNSDNWKAMQEVIDQWIESLSNIPVNPNEDSVESVGFRYLASKVTVEYLTDLKNMPQRFTDMKKQAEEKNE